MTLRRRLRRGGPAVPPAPAEAAFTPVPTSHFGSPLPSLRAGLRFNGRFAYTFALAPDATAPRHAEAVARSVLRQEAAGITSRFRPLDTQEAEDAVNAALATPLSTDPRMTIEGKVLLTLDPDTELLARRQHAAEQNLIIQHHEDTVRLELLRDRMLDPHLGLLSWLERHAERLCPSDITKERINEMLTSFQTLHTSLLRTRSPDVPTDSTLLRARADALLATLEDPTTATAAARVLEELVHVICAEHEEQERRTPGQPTAPTGSPPHH